MGEVKKQYNQDYWIAQLIETGQQLEPEKYTDEHIASIQKAWRAVPLSALHSRVLKRQRELLTQTQ